MKFYKQIGENGETRQLLTYNFDPVFSEDESLYMIEIAKEEYDQITVKIAEENQMEKPLYPDGVEEAIAILEGTYKEE